MNLITFFVNNLYAYSISRWLDDKVTRGTEKYIILPYITLYSLFQVEWYQKHVL